MTIPRFVSSETERKLPILIVDRKGLIGELLADALKHEFLTILVSSHVDELLRERIVHIPFRSYIPRIPDNSFSHVFVVYDGTKTIIGIFPSLAKKAEESRAVFVVLVRVHDADKKFYTLLSRICPTAKVILLGDIFGGAFLIVPSSTTHLLYQAGKGEIVIQGTGLRKLYPVYFVDVVTGVLNAVFSDHGLHNVFFLFPKHASTELSVARLIRNLYPLVKLDFSREKTKEEELFLPQHGVFLLPDPYPLSERLRLVDMDDASSSVLLPSIKEEKPLPSFLKWSIIVLSISLSLVLAPILLLSGFGLVGGMFLSQSVKAIEKGDFSLAKQRLSQSKQAFLVGEAFSEKLITPSGFVGLSGIAKNASTQMQTGKKVLETISVGVDALLLYQHVVSGKSNDPKKDFLQAVQESKSVAILLSQLQAEKRLPEVYSNRLSLYQRPLSLFVATSDVLPTLLGFEGKRKYLVLFQNNMELRPGGGFIGSYGLLTLENAKVLSFTIHDVYDADGKLVGHIEPPYPLKRHLGASHWFLRDTNVSADFPTNAKQAAYFLNLEVGEAVDGVIAVDVSFIRGLLESLGPVRLPDYNKEISGNSFFTLVEKEAQSDFFPGSTQKRDILTAVYRSLNQSIFVEGKVPIVKLAGVVVSGIEQKHMLFAFPDVRLQRLFTVNNLSGALFDERKDEANVVNDFFALSESNLGSNKANYSVKRAIEHTVRIGEDGRVNATATVTYVHSAKKEDTLGGDYKNYFRVVLPKGTTFEELRIDGEVYPLSPAVTDPTIYQASLYKAKEGVEVEITEEIGKSVFGFLVVVLQGERRTLQFTYQEPKTILLSDPTFTYDLRVVKQPGTEHDPYFFTLVFPEGFRPLGIPNGVKIEGNNVVLSTLLSTDRSLRVAFAKK